MKDLIEKNENLDLAKKDMHVICGTLKLYFRSLSDPLITYASYPKFLNMHKMHSKNPIQWMDGIQKLISELPLTNRITLKRLFSLLNKVSTNCTTSKMHSQNLSIVIAPDIMFSKDESPLVALQDTPIVNGLIRTMIDLSEVIFADIPDTIPILKSDKLKKNF